MVSELNLLFNNSQQVTIHLAQRSSVTVAFAIPFTAQDREAIRHYLEVYAAQYVMDIDDQEAKRIIEQLPQWGQKLFDTVFSHTAAQELFSQFISTSSDKHLLTVTAQQPEILSLPWELLHHAGQFLFAFQPSITILRRISSKTTFPAHAPQLHLHILFVISRPQGESFLNPRTDAQAVLTASERYPTITVEFLQPATLENFWQRLQNPELPQVDVIHFDGHGVFDKTGRLERQVIEQRERLSRNLRKLLRGLKIGANTGYLLFEKSGRYGDNGRDSFYVPTSWLIHLLSTAKVRLVVLSACQSAMIAHDDEGTGEEPIGSIAMGLVANGTPSVLAMSYSVMVRATELLWGKFYQAVAQGKTVGTALDEARHILLQDRKRRDLQRGQERVEIEVYDWFLPTLYQANMDAPLLVETPPTTPAVTRLHNLSVLPTAGFWGRQRELWQIENWFIDGIRRVVVSGFSGQGKTFLAQELGRWLLQKRRFDAVVFVDYSGYQGLDAVQWAVTTLGSVDIAAANAVLQNRRVLLILDNLEVYVEEKKKILQELLETAYQWSLLGETRIVITTRPVTLGHEAYQVNGKNEDFRQLVLEGLDKEDALRYFEKLMALSDKPVRLQTEELLRWFEKVQFHPLSLGLLGRCLETEDLANLETRLNQLMLELPNDPVKATLQLVIEQLDEEAQKLLPRLGVFQGGAMENALLEITEVLVEEWAKLRTLLETTGLIQVETWPNISIPYLQFHPSLTTVLPSDNQDDLYHRYQRRYYELSDVLYYADIKSHLATLTIVKRELPNLLFAVKGVLAETTDYAVDFVDNVNRFLNYLGLQRDLVQLNQQAVKLAGEVGNQNWFLSHSNVGEQFFNAGRYTEAANIFKEILNGLGTTASYNRCLTLNYLGRCFCEQEQAEQAIICYQQGLETAKQLEQTQRVQHQISILYTDLASALIDKGRYADAKASYEQSLAIKKQIGGDERGEVVILGELGTLALVQGKWPEAERRYKAALDIFQRFSEPNAEAVFWNQLGSVYDKTKRWEDAERAYRQAAKIREAQGNLSDAAQTWNNLAITMKNMGKWVEAEAWYRKAIEVDRQLNNPKNVARDLSNLANLLQNQPDRFLEAQQLAEQALVIFKTLDSAGAEFWKIYNILAKIADQRGNAQEAKKNRHLSRSTKANFAGTRYELKQKRSELILAVARAENVEVALKYYGEDWNNLKTAIQQILAGERDVEKLREPLDYEEAPIVMTILEGIAHPESLAWLEEPEPSQE